MEWKGKRLHLPQISVTPQIDGEVDYRLSNIVPEFLRAISAPDRQPFGWQEWLAAQAHVKVKDPDALGWDWQLKKMAVCVPRQNGKGDFIEHIELVQAIFFPASKILHTAHKGDTTREAFERMEKRINAVGALKKRLRRIKRSNGYWEVQFTNDSVIRYRTRTSDNTRGFGYQLIIVDEAMYFLHDHAESLVPTTSAQEGTRVIYVYTGLFSYSDYMHHNRANCLQPEDYPNWGLFEWALPEGADYRDPDWWEAVNPSMLDGLITRKTVQTELAELREVGFLRERMISHEFPQEEGSAIPITAWRACHDETSTHHGPISLGVFAAVDLSHSWIASASTRQDGKIHVELIASAEGTEWVASWLAAEYARFDDLAEPVILSTKTGANVITADLDRLGVPWTSLGPADWYGACGTVAARVTEARIVHLNQPELTASVHGLKKHERGQSFMWSWVDSREPGAAAAMTYAVAGAIAENAKPDPAPVPRIATRTHLVARRPRPRRKVDQW